MAAICSSNNRNILAFHKEGEKSFCFTLFVLDRMFIKSNSQFVFAFVLFFNIVIVKVSVGPQ